jgi:DNA-binding NtrC family response regulator
MLLKNTDGGHMKPATNVIFYINDHPDIATVANLACASIGCVVEFIEQPEVGLAALKGMRPAAVIVDVFMARIDVRDFVWETRSLHPDVPIFLVTAAPEIEKYAAELNVAAYLAKPFELAQFMKMVDTHVPEHLRGTKSKAML